MNRDSTSRGRRPYRGGYRGRLGHTPQFENRTRQIAGPLGDLLKTINFDDLHRGTKNEKIGITDCRYIASYNLLAGLQKTIFIPGRPPVWTPLPASTKLQQDSGDYYRDENAARFPDYPFEPAVKSIVTMDKSFDTSQIDIFGCGSTLGDLLRFVTGKPQPFTFIVQRIGKTVFFIRRNLSPDEVIEDIRGYGHAFPEAYTTWTQDVKGSDSHQRVIKYAFGGMRLLVRFEADGYVLDQADDFDDEDEQDFFPSAKSKNGKGSDAALEDIFAGLHSSQSAAAGNHGQPLLVQAKGSRTSQSSIFDMKTRAAYKDRNDIMEEQLPRLWVRQISKLILAFHTYGVFEDPDIRDVAADIAAWEETSKSALQRMAAVLKDIRNAAMALDGGKLEVRGDESSRLQLRELSADEEGEWNALSDVLQKGWGNSFK